MIIFRGSGHKGVRERDSESRCKDKVNHRCLQLFFDQMPCYFRPNTRSRRNRLLALPFFWKISFFLSYFLLPLHHQQPFCHLGKKQHHSRKMKKYIETLQELLKQVNKKHLIAAAAAVVIFILGFISGCSCSGRGGAFGGKNLGVTEALDSFAQVIPEGSQIVARFTDNRHSLFYLNSGRLMRFNAKSKMLEEVIPYEINKEARVYYNEKDDVQGILSAQLSDDEQFIIITAVTDKKEDDDEEVATATYKLNTSSMNLLPFTPPPAKAAPVKKDSVRRSAAPVKQQQAIPMEDLPEVGDIVQPEDNTPKPAAEPKPSPAPQPEEKPAPRGQETVIVPAQ